MQQDIKPTPAKTDRRVSRAALRKAGFKLIRYDAVNDSYLLSRGRVTRWVSAEAIERARGAAL